MTEIETPWLTGQQVEGLLAKLHQKSMAANKRAGSAMSLEAEWMNTGLSEAYDDAAAEIRALFNR